MDLSPVKKILEEKREQFSKDMEKNLEYYADEEEEFTADRENNSPQDESKINLGKNIQETLKKQ